MPPDVRPSRDRDMKALVDRHVTVHQWHGEWNCTIAPADTPG
jgi:hypothetical protein